MKVIGPVNDPHPAAIFIALIASVKLAKLVPIVGNVLSIVKTPPANGKVEDEQTNEMSSIAAGGFVPPPVSFFHTNTKRIVDAAEQLPATEAGIDKFAIAPAPAGHKL